MALSVSKRVAVVVVAATSISLLAACDTPGPGGVAGKVSYVNPNKTTAAAHGWEVPKQKGLKAGTKGARGAHQLVAIAPPGGEEIETADIAAPRQRAGLAGNPAAKVAGNAVRNAEIIVRSLKRR